MKTIKKNTNTYILALCTVIIAVFVVSCNKKTSTTPIQSDVSPTAKAVVNENNKTAIYDLIQKDLTHEYTLLSTHNDTENQQVITEMKKNYALQSVALVNVARIVDRKNLLYKGDDFRYINATGVLDKKYTVMSTDGDFYHVKASVYYYMPTNDTYEGLDPSDTRKNGQPVTTEGYEAFEYTVIDSNGVYFIYDKSKLSDFPANTGEEQVSVLPNTNDNTPEKKTRGSYSSTAAVNFSIAYFATPPSTGYYNYTSSGGDCTNFLSHCLKTGGWSQVANWHWSSNGTSCNSMSCPRSPGWTGAYAFYQYITGVGSGRVISQFADLVVPSSSSSTAFVNSFNNTAWYLNKGDIIQVASTTSKSSIGHSTLVTYKKSSLNRVYVTYRTATGYLASRDKPIKDLGSGYYLQGFKVKATY